MCASSPRCSPETCDQAHQGGCGVCDAATCVRSTGGAAGPRARCNTQVRRRSLLCVLCPQWHQHGFYPTAHTHATRSASGRRHSPSPRDSYP
eukprot:1721221-Prymnesium_polylepis.2